MRHREGWVGVRPTHRKDQSTSVSNIRESSYKIMRSSSNRTEHSLSTKKPILLPSTSAKRIRPATSKEDPETPLQPRINPNKYQTIAYPETAFTLKGAKQATDRTIQQKGPERQKIQSQLDCLQAIWQNIKKLKAKGTFSEQVYELQAVLQRIVFKLAQQENCLQQREGFRENIHNKGNSTGGNTGRAKLIFEGLQSTKGRESIKSSLDSLRIENEDSHKLEFLEIYSPKQEERPRESLAQGLRDITNLSYPSSLSFSDCQSSSQDRQDDRIYLRSIVKRSKRTPNDPKTPSHCCENPPNAASINFAYECRLLECEFNQKAPSSSGSSQSKREVLNQIISMLNSKYQRTLNKDPAKVFI